MMSTKEAYEDYLDVLADKIEYKEFDITECTFDFHVIELPHEGKKTPKDDVVIKKSICRIVSDDDICLSRSIITALSIQNPDHLMLKKLTAVGSPKTIPFKPFNELEIGKRYPVNELKRITTKDGN
ncbi:uncharacterized protein TNCT_308931 [Trichonephila clavata]|uniref:Uncharacterized protein n=1 Tax=Trichonephila clavata TaxID=2740835 RepID=A0A8X6FC14_TRICU|nr:uncharacterized protein TNCT_308931 [Trichonephila clavata]